MFIETMFFPLLAPLTLLVSGAGANNTPDNVSSRLQVQIPKDLFKPGGYDHREALFGSPPYSGSISQIVYYTDTDLCDKNDVDPTSGYPTRENNQPWQSPFILMANRGSCSFVQKARNAQHAGAAGLVIADNLCLCNDQKCLNGTDSEDSYEPCQSNEPIMADDGSGGDITIPTFLMFKADANLIKKEVKDRNGIVQLEMNWPMPNPDSRVEYELWTVPSDVVSKAFQKDWKDIAQKLGDHSYFTPHQYIYDGVKSRCHGADGRNLCLNLCTNNGRYCATDPDNDLEHGTTGAEVVTEALRRICIWKYYGADDGVGTTYWDYIFEFLKLCDSDDFFANKDCINDVYKNSKIDGKKIDTCMVDSGGVEGDSPNTLLEKELDSASKRGVVVLPTIFVNNVVLRGSLTANTVFNAVCAGFHEGSAPIICDECKSCSQNVVECVRNNGSCPTSTESGGYSNSISSNEEQEGNTEAVPWFDEDKLAELLMPIALKCFTQDVSLNKITTKLMMLSNDYDYEYEEMVDEITGMVFDILENYCDDSEASQFETALEDFHQCSGFNLKDFSETFADAYLGININCGRYVYDIIKKLDSLNDPNLMFPLPRVPAQCVDAFVGDNPFGNMFRSLLEYPYQGAKCFEKLNLELPQCTLKVWPIPLPGSIMKVTSCLRSEMIPIMEAACDNAYNLADECFVDPRILENEQKDEDTCANWTRECFKKGLYIPPAPFNGLPTADIICENKLEDHKDAVAKIRGFQASCVKSQDMEYWKTGSGSTIISSYNNVHTTDEKVDSKITVDNNDNNQQETAVSGTAILSSHDNVHKNDPNEKVDSEITLNTIDNQQKTTPVTASGRNSGIGTFFSGFFVGSGLIVATLFVKQRYGGSYQQLQPEKGGEVRLCRDIEFS